MQIEYDNRVTAISAAVSGVIAGCFFFWWLSFDPTTEFHTWGPNLDNRPAESELLAAKKAAAEVITIGEFFDRFDGRSSPISATWPRFRGPRADNISPEHIPLARSWGKNGPQKLWQIALGEGHAGPAVANGNVYLLDYDEEKKADALRCFSLEDGSEIWRRWYQVHVKRNHGYSRTVPAATGKFVVTMGPRCHVMCVDAQTGDYLWGIDLEKEFATEVPFWYTGQCPLIDDGVAVIAPGGKALMIGVDCATGEIRWQTPNPDGWKMSHSSIMRVKLFGKAMYVYCANGGIFAVSAENGEKGKLLWKSTHWSASVSAPSPLVLDDGRIYVAGGYGSGAALLKVNYDGANYTVDKLLKYKPDAGMATEQQTPLLYQKHFFTIQPKDAGVLRKQLACYSVDDITKPVWTSGATHRFGLGPYLIADGKMFVLSDDGVLTMLEVSTTAYRQIAQARVIENGADAWGPMALVAGRLLLRDSHQLVCLDLRQN